MNRFRNEIGSEFWLEKNLPIPIDIPDNTFVYSGRTAIDLIIQDIQKQKTVRKAYLPAYCCESMIQPFMERGIEVLLYDVYLEDGILRYDIDNFIAVDIFYVCNYFGYDNEVSDKIISDYHEQGATIIYDRTHSLFYNYDAPIKLADYTFASIRKWMGVISGAEVCKTRKTLNAVLQDAPYLNIRQEAMEEKGRYMNGDTTIIKESFLLRYGEFNKALTNDYRNYRMDSLSYALWLSTDFVKIKSQRQTNAKTLHSLDNVNYLGVLKEQICPLFVPICFDNKGQRDRVRQILTDAEIYCPIHWPKNSLVKSSMKVNRLFETELSLVCDQRYNEADMQRIVEIIKTHLN